MSPWVALALFMVGNGLAGSGTIMIIKGTYPPPMTHIKSSPVLATFLLLLGMTMILHFGTPELLAQIIDQVF